MKMQLVKGKKRTFTRTGIPIDMAGEDANGTIKVDASFEVMPLEQYTSLVKSVGSDHELSSRIVLKVSTPDIDCTDETGAQLNAEDVRALLLSQPEITHGLIRFYGAEIKGGEQARRRGN